MNKITRSSSIVLFIPGKCFVFSPLKNAILTVHQLVKSECCDNMMHLFTLFSTLCKLSNVWEFLIVDMLYVCVELLTAIIRAPFRVSIMVASEMVDTICVLLVFGSYCF